MDNKTVCVEIGRPIQREVIKQFGKIDKVISYKGNITKNDIKPLLKEVIDALEPNGTRLILSGPVAFNFMLGQLVGLNHYKLKVYQYNPEIGYEDWDCADRNILFHED